MSMLSEHPKKAEINALITSNVYSYRELEKELATRFGVKISYKSIQQYHTKELNGLVDTSEAGDGGDGGDGGEKITLDTEKINSLVKELTTVGFTDQKETLKGEIAELFAIQLQITKHALLQHTNGLARYPSEYVRNLMLFSNLLLK